MGGGAHRASPRWGAVVRWLAILVGIASLVACDPGAGPGPEAEESLLGPPDPDGWSTLIEVDWELEPGSEAFLCALQTVTEDVYIQAFRAGAPYGTHHTLLTITEPKGPDEIFECGPGTLSDAMIFASGIGTDDLVFPEGVAIRVPAGKQILLNLHLLNATPKALSGTSSTLVRTLAPEEVVDEAEVVFAGTIDFSLPPQSETVATGSCVFEEEATLLSLWPHMHQHGTHMVIEHHGAHGVSTLHDAPYDTIDQLNSPIAPTVVRAGDRIDVTCRWYNGTDETVPYGDSSSQEMCFAGMYRYPAFSQSLYCGLPFQ